MNTVTSVTPKVKVNRCQCTVCLSVIESKHRHDFVKCQCGRIFTDGGTEYIRRGFTDSPNEIKSLDEFWSDTLDSEAV